MFGVRRRFGSSLEQVPPPKTSECFQSALFPGGTATMTQPALTMFRCHGPRIIGGGTCFPCRGFSTSLLSLAYLILPSPTFPSKRRTATTNGVPDALMGGRINEKEKEPRLHCLSLHRLSLPSSPAIGLPPRLWPTATTTRGTCPAWRGTRTWRKRRRSRQRRTPTTATR